MARFNRSIGLVDGIIVGQGLAGSLLAHECIQNGLTILVVDDKHKTSSTKVAAGIMNPLVGPRLTPLLQDYDAIQRLSKYYKALQNSLGASFLHEHRLIRFLSTPLECQSYRHRITRSDGPKLVPPTQDWSHRCVIGEHQFELHAVPQVDTTVFLDAMKNFLMRHNALINQRVSHNDIDCSEGQVNWQGLRAKWLVFCEGAVGDGNPFFPEKKFKNAMGHVLKVRMEGMPKKTILNHGKWLCPVANSDQDFLYGASTFWNQTMNQQAQSIRGHQSSLQSFLKLPHAIVSVHEGTRPCLAQQRPFAGWSQKHSTIGMINGLGGQGMAVAPDLVRSFCQQLRVNKVIKT